MLTDGVSYADLLNRFSWHIPEHFNIGTDVCDRWAAQEPDRTALIFVEKDGTTRNYSYSDLKTQSNQLANLLSKHGLGPGDRAAILLSQTPETAFAHIAIYKIGAIAVPLFTLFGTDALSYRLANSGAKVLITDQEGARKIKEIRDGLPELETVLTIDGSHDGSHDLHAEMTSQSTSFQPHQTRSNDPALIIFTSGTTGPPKGALHAHRTLLGHLPGVEMSHNLFPKPGDRIWTPADWAWIGGLLDVLLPALHHGVPVVARRFDKFSGEDAFQLMQDQNVRNTFLPPTALKMMYGVADAEKRWKLNLRSVASGGESLGSELLEWGRRVFGLTINEFYGQTECNMIVSSCAALMEARPGKMGRPVPGHQLAILDNDGTPVPDGTLGTIAVKRPNPVMFLEYWNNPNATRDKFVGDWLLTGDRAICDTDGWFQFIGRDDDVITSSGYRIGPGEIEDCLIAHPAISMAGVIGVPDEMRTQIVKAYVVLNDGFKAGEALRVEIQQWVKSRLAAHEYPREVEFVSDLPLTATGKLIRSKLRQLASDG